MEWGEREGSGLHYVVGHDDAMLVASCARAALLELVGGFFTRLYLAVDGAKLI